MVEEESNCCLINRDIPKDVTIEDLIKLNRSQNYNILFILDQKTENDSKNITIINTFQLQSLLNFQELVENLAIVEFDFDP